MSRTFAVEFKIIKTVETRGKAFNELTSDLLFIFADDPKQNVYSLLDWHSKLAGRSKTKILIVQQVMK